MSDFYDKVYHECEKVLGEKTRDFLDRQIKGHLKIQPQDLQPENKDVLIKWLKISISLFKGREKSEELMKTLKEL
ncbi:MAG: hypothetical protein JW774_03645 [Candidatus Aureabacteria bacterium]|nr:hypothetical protein [Candidatus Auribacterota bacterium]